MQHKIFFLLGLFGITSAFAQYPFGEEILNRIDMNMSSKNRKVVSKMVIHGRRGSRTIESQSWVEGTDKSFTEYLAPAREKGTKMLKLEDRLWIYSPSTDRTIQISGHMLRQSVMGSDLSYEDMLEDPKMTNDYEAVVIGEEEVDDRLCWIVELTAKHAEVAYHFRKMWVDQKRDIPIMQELIAKSGTLLKRMELKDVTLMGGRWYPKRFIFKDMLKSGKGTEFLVESIEFDVAIPGHLFTKAALR
ncbi:outer membrane lipoprotein-sorting protein [candidate division KSB1 bacterium]|nr:outer membrane lipoprotein-sorting protein [candidate division KSB1 bacterium]